MSPTFPVLKEVDLPALEEEVLARWEAERVFERSIEARRDGPVFSFYEGPPTANGQPGIHHVLGRTIKDLFCRYRTLKGCYVSRKAGWDTHGLPVEIEVEKELGLEGREQIEAYGIARFNAACRASVLRYKARWDALTRRIGYWVDLEHPYVTFENRYIETVWWLVRQIHEQGLLYRGHRVQWYSPASGTALSSHEVSLGYREVDDPSVYVRFPLAGEPDTALLAWTTTPWTLLSNAALAVGPTIEYVRCEVRRDGASEQLIVAADRIGVLQGEVRVIERLPGRALVGREYRPPYRLDGDPAAASHRWRVVAAEFVSTEDGTGIVHIAPAFGAEDAEVGEREGLPVFNPVRPDGRFADDAPLVAGLWFKDADPVIIEDLARRGLLYRRETCRHNYPHDWRKGTPLMMYPVESWFVRTTARRDRLVALNRTINWHPPAIGEGRFGNWLEGNIDWGLSRQRYWGTPLPVWCSDAPGSEYFEVIGSIAELRSRCGDQLPPDDVLDLHRPFVDELTWPAPDGGTMRRVPYVMDVWFDSGAMPFAQWHYPFENQEAFERTFPADFICEGLDQTRGWFYTLHAIATLVCDSVAFRNVVVNGLILDENGEKMSKSRGNVVDPFDVVGRHGADVVRWYLIASSPPWENKRFSERALVDVRRRFFGTLENVYAFFASYANIDGFTGREPAVPPQARSELDRWMLSRLNDTIARADAAYDGYDATRAVRAVERLVDDLSNWYIRRSRRRFWSARKGEGGADDRDKLAAYQTTFECLLAIARLMSPVAPFYSDWLYCALTGGNGDEALPSVHLADFPVADPGLVDQRLEAHMALARTIVTAALELRNKARINVRQPLSRVLVVLGGPVTREAIDAVAPIVLEEINVERIELVEHGSELVRRRARPVFPRLGPRLGKRMAAAARAIQALDDEAIERYLAEGSLTIEVGGEPVTLGEADIEVFGEAVGDWLVTQHEGVTVALDTRLDDALVRKGLARETINRIQNMRKRMDLALTDRIRVEVAAGGRLAEAIEAHREAIAREVLAVDLRLVDEPAGEYRETFRIDGERLVVALSRAA